MADMKADCIEADGPIFIINIGHFRPHTGQFDYLSASFLNIISDIVEKAIDPSFKLNKVINEELTPPSSYQG